MTVGTRYLLDSNVLSESRKKLPEARVVGFLSTAEPAALYISVLTLGELRKGVALKGRSDPASARLLSSWVDGLEFSFSDRIVGIDAATAKLWGEISAERPRAVIDTLIAATAITQGMTLVTRNTGDVEDLDMQLLNPWLVPE